MSDPTPYLRFLTAERYPDSELAAPRIRETSSFLIETSRRMLTSEAQERMSAALHSGPGTRRIPYGALRVDRDHGAAGDDLVEAVDGVRHLAVGP